MALYRFASPSLIDELRIVRNATGGLRAYAHAGAHAEPAQLQGINDKLSAMGLMALPLTQDGRPALEIRGFESPAALTAQLQQLGVIQGDAAISSLPDDAPTPEERRRNMTLKATGWAYNVGDAAYMTYVLRGFRHEKTKLAGLSPTATAEIQKANDAIAASKFDIGAGLGYAMGGTALTFFAGKDQSQQDLRAAMKKVSSYMQRDAVTVPNDVFAQDMARRPQQSLYQRASSLITRYPSETLNTIYVGVGGLLAHAAIKRARIAWVPGEKYFSIANKEARHEITDIGLGAITLTSSLAGLLIKEKKDYSGKPKRDGLFGLVDWVRQDGASGVWHWVQEKPLRATGYGFMIATGFHAHASYGKYRDGTDEFLRKNVMFRAVFVAANVVAELLMAISSKGHGQGVKADDSIENSVIAATAEIIARQPEQERDGLVHRLAGFLATQDLVGSKTPAEVAAALQQQVRASHTNPWARQDVVAQGSPQGAASPGTKVSQVTRMAQAAAQSTAVQPASWQDKLGAKSLSEPVSVGL